ncbi:helix-turn-helix domain-containing protein [Herpetosiphon giganteus]|uniref:helix-turn-helix domain-containing protein n=1 Tax=Herpetosiphon giganteus TaxID=2029754 RepID=UPI0019585542
MINGVELRKQFGRRIRYLRRLNDLTQNQLAERTNYSTEYISRIERGIGNPSFDTIAALATALDVEASTLFMFPPNV